MTRYKTKRIYEPVDEKDGFRVLVDRLWPRGFSKKNAHIDLWAKDIAPTNELRNWFHHEDGKWSDFVEKYSMELNGNEALEKIITQLHKHQLVTLLYAAQNKEHNQAVFLKAYFESLE